MPSVQEALDRFLQVDRSPFTTKNYAHILNNLVKAIGPVRDISRVTYEDLADYFYPAIKGRKRSTAVVYLNVIQNFFRFCLQLGYVSASPANNLRLRRGGAESVESRAIPPEELAAMVEYARLTSKRDYAIMLFMVATGCRVGGITSLTLKNLDLEHMRALLHEKGDNWSRVWFGERTTLALREWLDERPKVDHDYVFTLSMSFGGRAMQRHNYARLVGALALKVGASHKWGPHAIRHSRGHALARRGFEESVTQRALNHASPTTTIQFYYPHDEDYISTLLREYELAALEEPKRAQGGNVIPLQRQSG
jgi:integrase